MVNRAVALKSLPPPRSSSSHDGRDQHSRSPPRAAILNKAVSDRGTLGGLTQFTRSRSVSNRKLLNLIGEMSEWLKEHAWKAKRASETTSLRSASTHTRSAS